MSQTVKEPLSGDPITLSIQDVAAHLRLKADQTVRDLVARGELPPHDFRLSGRPRWLRSKFLEALESKSSESRPSQGSATHQEGKGAARSLAGGAAASRQDPGGASPSHSTEGERDAG